MKLITQLSIACMSLWFASISFAEQVQFEEPVSEIYFPASADIDGDGVDDVVISAQIDAYAQLGIKCCEVPAEMVDSMTGIVPQIYLSNYGSPKLISFPSDAVTHRTWAGAFFDIEGSKYYIHGRNGELGLPSQNKGERTQIYRVNYDDEEISLALVSEFPVATTTASIAVRTIQNGVEILENNYNAFDVPPAVYQSQVYQFSSNETLSKVTPEFSLRNRIAHNEISYSSILDGYVLASTEVWKNNSGTVTMSHNPSSYYSSASSQMDIEPVLYGSNHAGFSIKEIVSGDRVYVIEISSEFFGHQNGGFKNSAIGFYELDAASRTIAPCSVNCVDAEINLPNVNQVYLNKIDIDFDGVDEIYITGYQGNRVQIFHGSDSQLRQVISRRFELQNVNGWFGRLQLLRDVNRECIFSISASAGFSEGRKNVPITVSSCRERRF